jgi:hypothetical protein
MAAVGMFLLSLVTTTSSYVTHVLPSMIIISLGLGLAFVSLASTALFNVRGNDTGAASAVLSSAQQLGGSFGTSIQSTIVASSAAAFAATAIAKRHKVSLAIKAASQVHGYDEAFRFGAIMFVAAALAFFFLVNIDRHHLAQHDDTSAVIH